MDCSKCGFTNPDTHKFCGECGAPLSKVQVEAERRLLTVMFCDLAGSTALSERLDPEDLHDILTAYQDRCRVAIDRYDGFVAKYMGDGILVYFGYPVAHEDDAQRAVWAALEIVEEVPALAPLANEHLAVRIGIATGEVVVGDTLGEGASEERSVLGVTPNLAARLQDVAGENEIVVSDATKHRLGDKFDILDLGALSLKGIAEPSQSWRVDGAAKAQREPVEEIPFIGRAGALKTLDELLAKSRADGLEIISITGLPGIGKTRLVSEFLARHDDLPHEDWTCSAFHSNRPLHPIPGSGSAAAPATSENALIQTGEAQRKAVFDAITEALASRATSSPLVLFVEDAHWIDPTTADLLVALRDRLARRPLLIILTCRDSPDVESLAKDLGAQTLALQALGDRDAMSLVEAASGARIEDETRRQIIDRAGGLPLFLEELIRVVASGNGDSVPASLQESLLARLDSLGPAKRLAQLAAVVGRAFTLTDLQALSETNDMPVTETLEQLLSAGLLTKTNGQFAFRHALMHEAAYDTLLHSTRRRIHGEIADRMMAEGADEIPEAIARHLSGAGRQKEAATYWCLAAARSAKLWAHAEAATYFERALTTDEPFADRHWELTTRLDLVESLRIIDRYDQALAQLDLAEDIARDVGTDADWLRLYTLRGNILFPLGQAERCIAAHESALAVAQRMDDPAAEAKVLSGLADAQFANAHMASAEKFYDDCVALAEANGLTAITLANLSMRGHMRLYLCRLAEARSDSERAVELSVAAGNRRAEMTARGSCLGKILLDAGEYEAADQAFEKAGDIAADLGAHRYEALNLLFRGKVALETGAGDLALDFGRRAVAIARQSAVQFCLPMAIGVVARAETSADACRVALDEGEALIAAGCLVHNPLWFYRDAGLAAVRHDWPDEARRYSAALEDAFADEPLPWCALVAEGVRELATFRETGSRSAVQAAIARAQAKGFNGWAQVIAGLIEDGG